ncbi:peptidoglycan editing factor PgeF [Thiovibrio sp. JS02]
MTADLRIRTFANLGNLALRHAVFGRTGGVSTNPYHSLNVGLHVGDNEALVRENRRRIKEHLGLRRLVSARQVHGKSVKVVACPPEADTEFDGFDALVTNLPGVGLAIQQADCQAIMLYDPEQRAIANIHAGWRGSVQNIVAATVTVMQQTYGSRPEALVAAISPSLGPCCAEFANSRAELPMAFHAHQARPRHFDFWAISRAQLTAAGLRTENIEIAGICTKCDPDYFSYRREKVTGRFASVIGLAGSPWHSAAVQR